MSFKRKHARADVGRVGRLQLGAFSAPCKVLDVSESGVLLESRLFVKRGDVLQLGIALTCGLEVVHVRTPKLGAKIISISPEDRERLTHILEDHAHNSLSRG